MRKVALICPGGRASGKWAALAALLQDSLVEHGTDIQVISPEDYEARRPEPKFFFEEVERMRSIKEGEGLPAVRGTVDYCSPKGFFSLFNR